MLRGLLLLSRVAEKTLRNPMSSLSPVKKPPTKGKLISECLLSVIDFPKNQQFFLQISALESKKWSNQQSKSTFL